MAAGWLPVHRDQLRTQRSVTSMGSLYLFKNRKWYNGLSNRAISNDLEWPSRLFTDCKPFSNEIFSYSFAAIDKISSDVARCAILYDSWCICFAVEMSRSVQRSALHCISPECSFSRFTRIHVCTHAADVVFGSQWIGDVVNPVEWVGRFHHADAGRWRHVVN